MTGLSEDALPRSHQWYMIAELREILRRVFATGAYYSSKYSERSQSRQIRPRDIAHAFMFHYERSCISSILEHQSARHGMQTRERYRWEVERGFLAEASFSRSDALVANHTNDLLRSWFDIIRRKSTPYKPSTRFPWLATRRSMARWNLWACETSRTGAAVRSSRPLVNLVNHSGFAGGSKYRAIEFHQWN